MKDRNQRDAPLTAVTIGVGDELLYGQTVNTNGSWLGQELSTLGVTVLRQDVVGDAWDTIQEATEIGLRSAELVVVTGGLGPTPDDLTRPAVALQLGYTLEEDPTVLEELRARFRILGHDEVPPNNRLMAQVPKGAGVLPNPVGAAPGLVMESPEGKTVVLLPGIPAEMMGIFSQEVVPLLKSRFGERLRPTHHRLIHTTGIPESLLATEIHRVLPGERELASMAFLPDVRGVRLRLTAQGITEADANRRFDEIEKRLEGVLAPYRYRAGSGDLAEALGNALDAGGISLAVAESCTGGLIAKRITDQPGSSKYFRGGVVAYSDEIKTGHLGISRSLLQTEGAVSRSVARAMAVGVADRMGALAGIGVTGVAGPGGGSEEKPVGTVCYAACFGGTVSVRKQRFLGNRESVRERAAQASMALLLALVEGRAL